MVEQQIFKGITEKEWRELDNIGGMKRKAYEKGEIILHMGEQCRAMGIVMEGSIHIESVDLWGNRSIVSQVSAGQVFAETYALCQEILMVDVVAARPAKICFFDLQLLLQTQNFQNSWYIKLLGNLLLWAAEKNFVLLNRLFCISSKDVRGRLLTYLNMEAVKRGSKEFQIPFDRQQMADYLNLDRSALSKELGKMQREGILTFHKNNFHILK